MNPSSKGRYGIIYVIFFFYLDHMIWHEFEWPDAKCLSSLKTVYDMLYKKFYIPVYFTFMAKVNNAMEYIFQNSKKYRMNEKIAMWFIEIWFQSFIFISLNIGKRDFWYDEYTHFRKRNIIIPLSFSNMHNQECFC